MIDRVVLIGFCLMAGAVLARVLWKIGAKQ